MPIGGSPPFLRDCLPGLLPHVSGMLGRSGLIQVTLKLGKTTCRVLDGQNVA